MKKELKHVLLIILIIGCFLCAGVLGSVLTKTRFHPLSSFELQEKYANQLEKKLVNLLEPATGIGNVRASVQAEIRHQNTTQTFFDFENASRTTSHEKGPVLVAQSVSVLVNEKDKKKLTTYQNLIKGAIGFDENRGDYLAVEMLPFVKVPLWTLGLTPLCLMRIGAGLVLLIFVGLFWLSKELISTRKNQSKFYIFNESLWQQIGEIPANQLAQFLKVKRAEISAFILYRLPQQKAAEIIEILPKDYMNQVILHLDTIEKLPLSDRFPLAKETEYHLKEIIKAYHSENCGDNNFDSLKDWQDIDLQNLLHYISKKDLIRALKTASLGVQQALSRNIPPSLWQEMILKAQTDSCSPKESRDTQDRIMKLAELLKENQ